MSKNNVGLKHFFCKAFQNLNFMRTWCINSKNIFSKNDFPYHFQKIVSYKKIVYNNMTACFVDYPIKVNCFANLLIARRLVGLQTE